MAAQKLSASGEHQKAAEELEKAVRVSPGFAEAWVNLAAQHLHAGLYEQALAELSRAGEIAKPTAVAYYDSAFASFALHRDDDAFRSVRQALRLDPQYPQAHYLLGTHLAADRRTLPEGIAHLEQAYQAIKPLEFLIADPDDELEEVEE